MICLEANFHTWSSNLVVFGHLVSSCVTQATLETRVCHSRVYFNSHPTPLLSFYLLLSTSPPAAFPSLPNLPSLFPMSTQSPPLTRKSATGSSQGVHLFPIYYTEWIDAAHGNVCVARVSGSNFTLSLSQLLGYDWVVCTHCHFLFSSLIISLEMYAGMVISATHSHAPPFVLFTLSPIILVDYILMADMLSYFLSRT